MRPLANPCKACVQVHADSVLSSAGIAQHQERRAPLLHSLHCHLYQRRSLSLLAALLLLQQLAQGPELAAAGRANLPRLQCRAITD